MTLYRLALCFLALLLLVGFVVADNQITRAHGSTVAAMQMHNATIGAVEIHPLAATNTPRPTPRRSYVVPCCYDAWDTGYLWDRYDYGRIKAYIAVIGFEHAGYPRDEDEMNLWVSRGEAMYCDAGSALRIVEQKPDNSFGHGVELVTGNCAGWRGWVSETFIFYTHRLPRYQNQDAEG